jgi:hypothetical protein
MEKNFACAYAREAIAYKCFGGPTDDGHMTQIKETLNAALNCERIFNKKCKPKKEPQRKPQQQVKPALSENKDFMKYMQDITGLTGTALLIYVIISEGTRLFPLRNLVPVP